jgi:hypothetical protein
MARNKLMNTSERRMQEDLHRSSHVDFSNSCGTIQFDDAEKKALPQPDWVAFVVGLSCDPCGVVETAIVWLLFFSPLDCTK